MKIALVQIQSIPGDITANVLAHCRFVEHAVANKANAIFFPELSITGYEPLLARELMRSTAGWQIPELQHLADVALIQISFGAPIVGTSAPRIAMITLRPQQAAECYSKMHIHTDEMPFFESGTDYTGLLPLSPPIGLAICYEISVPEHVATVFKHGARLYLASVAKSASGITSAFVQLSRIAIENNCHVLMVNGIGPSDNFVSAGSSAIWNPNGKCVMQLDDKNSGILYFDTETAETAMFQISE